MPIVGAQRLIERYCRMLGEKEATKLLGQLSMLHTQYKAGMESIALNGGSQDVLT